ncbi:MAG: NAD(P)/FAD-dependent oxidoreductase [Vicinamibacteria bacterium]
MSESADCIIIGGGITGASIAYHLTKKGCRDVVLLEKDYLASKATSVCPGGIRCQWQDEAACLYARESVKFFENLEDELHPDFPLPFHQTGYLFMAHSPATLEIFQKNVALQNRLGIPSRILSPQEVSEIVPELDVEGIVGGAFCDKDGFIEDSDGLTQVMARRAKEKGARVRLEPALAIERAGDRITGVRTPSGRIDAMNVILAAGCDSPALAKPLGLELPIQVERRRMLYTERIERRVLEPLVAAMDIGWAGKQLIDGVVYMGYLREAKESKDDWAYTEQVAELFVDMMPSLAEIGIKRLVDGYYDSTPDGHPFLGGVSGFEGYFQAAGFSGHGYMLSPSVGLVMAEMVLGEKPSLPVEPFSFDRFAKSADRDGLVI